MYCCLYKTKLMCYNDVNNIGFRADFMKCPNCGVKADVVMSNQSPQNVKSVSFYWDGKK